MANVTKGSTAIRETSESGGVDAGDITRRTVVKEGDYDLLAAAQPARGSASADVAGYTVDTSRLTRRRGNLGKLVINLVPTSAYAGSASETVLTSKIEIDFVQYERPILTHPTLNEGAGNYMAVHLQRWIDSGKDGAFWTYTDAGGTQTLTVDEQAWAALIFKGVEGYLEFAPVVSRTRTYSGRPAVAAPGAIETPPETVAGFAYLKTCDRLVQNDDKSWTRTEQWTGARAWETLLYGT